MELDFDQHNSLSSWTYPYFVTEYIKNSTHGLERLLSYDVDCNSSLCKKPLGAAFQYIADKIYMIVVEDGVLEIILKHLLKEMNLTVKEKKQSLHQ